ncbi:MAG: RsmB/NOP family class I SAM-dependent RNA methyltransferase [bacterium]|nr:RsmB/NOP family class I SAM-dependent RNA methyltransferase [bacterium]
MKGASLTGHAAELLRIIWKSPQPADQITSEYFRSKKYIGSGERRFLSELVFAALRSYSLAVSVGALTFTNEQGETFPTEDHERAISGTLALSLSHLIPVDLEPSLRRAAGADADPFIETLPKLTAEQLDPEKLTCTQPWLLAETQRRWPDDADDMWKAMLAPAPLCLRVSARRATREQVLAGLRAEGIECEAGKQAPMAIIIHQRVNLLQHPLVMSGVVDIQDEGSQLIALACEAQQGQRILDACAGAGGKSMHLADIMNDQGEIIARDIEPMRLKETVTRARRAGLRSIVAEFDAHRGAARNRSDMFDVVLIDAPCTGMGTVRRIPLPKWRLTPDQLKRHTAKQLRLIQENSGKVVEGGSLVYATCSILPSENEDVVRAFLSSTSDFRLEYEAQVDPFHHGTDGLYMARLRKIR